MILTSKFRNVVIGALALLAIALFAGVASSVTEADEVILVPAYITGTVQMADMPVGSVSVYAYWGDQSASTNINGNGETSVDYSLTVNAPEGETPEYSVSVNGYFDGGSTYINFVSQQVAVTGFGTSVQDFGQVNPASITGTVQMGDEDIYYLNIEANGGGASSRTSFYPDGTGSATYTLYVDVPGVDDVTFNIPYYYNYFYLGDWDHYIRFGTESVVVSPGTATTQNYGTTDPAYVEGNVSVTNASLEYAYAYASSTNNDFSQARTDVNGDYRMAVLPDIEHRIYGNARVEGSNFNLPSEYTVPSTQTYVTPSGGDIETVDWVLTIARGGIAGDVTMSGPLTPDQLYIQASGPQSANTYLQENGPYAFDDLAVGTYSMYAYAIYDPSWYRYTVFPYSTLTGGTTTSRPRPVVEAGSVTTVDAFAEQAFVDGQWTISGTHALSEVSNDVYMNLYGVYNTPTYGGSGRDRINSQTGAFLVPVTAGQWRWSNINEIRFVNNDQENYLNSTIRYLNDYSLLNNPIDLVAGETVTRNLDYKTGDVTVTFLVEGGGVLSYPQLINGNCEKRDENNQLIWTYQINAYNYSQVNVETGTVTFVGLEGTCTLTARATVGGSTTTFGQLELQVVPGADVVVDIGGPTLNVEWPQPDYISETSEITVTGIVTDDTEVASVTVNGVPATLTSTGNPEDPVEVSFSVDIELPALGPNQLVSVATDTSDKSATDTRTVYWDEEPPHVDFTPADGTVTSSTEITVEGLARNDVEVVGVTVNGDAAAITLTGNENDPTEVEFSAPLTLEEGANEITVVVTDSSGRTTTEIHTVTVADNQPPECNDLDIVLDEDTIVIRALPCSDSDTGDTIDVEIVALSLTGVAPIVVTQDENTLEWEVTIIPEPNFNGDGGTFTYEATDASGAVSEPGIGTISVTPVNDQPVADANGPYVVGEGASITLDGTGSSDPDVEDILSFAWDLDNDGAFDDASGATPVFDAAGRDGPDTQVVRLQVCDPFDACDVSATEVEIVNIAPEIVSLALVGDVIVENESTTLTGSFSDPGVPDEFTLDIDWGDGTTQQVDLPAGSDSFAVPHTYLDDGDSPGNGTASDEYSVVIDLTDDDGGMAGTPEVGGRVFLTGHDPDFHAQGEPGAVNLFRIALNYVTSDTADDGPNPTTKFLWVESRIAPPQRPFHRIGELGLTALGLTLGDDYDRANAAELPSVNFEDYTAIAVASSYGGLLTRAELDALIARSDDIKEFVNGGGGLFASSECFPCGANLLAGATLPDLFGYVPVDVVSIPPVLPYVVQPFGTDLGLVNGDVNSPTHNSFADSADLNIVDIDNNGNGNPTTLAGNVLIGDTGFGADALITVNNIAPVLTVPDIEPIFGSPVEITGTFTDPGTLDGHAVTVDWGDGSPQVIALPLGARGFSVSHEYEFPSDRTISVCVDDDDLGQSCDLDVSVTYASTPGKITAGVLQLHNGGSGGFNAQTGDGETIKGELQYKDGSGKYHAHTMTDIAVSEDRTSGWFAGELTNGSTFVAYVEDNGEGGKQSAPDVFRLWIDGVPVNGDGSLSKGNLQIHKKP